MARLPVGDQRASFVNRLADDVHDAAERFQHQPEPMIGAPVSRNFLTANQTFGRVHGDRAHGVFTQMLGHFQNEAVAHVVGFQRVQDQRQITAVERNVDDGADDLGHLAELRCVRSDFFGVAALAMILTLFP